MDTFIYSIEDNAQQEYCYSKTLSKGEHYLSTNEHNKALKCFENCLTMAVSYNDALKQIEANCNIGIALFYLGNINDSYTKLADTYKKLPLNENVMNIEYMFLYYKVTCNYVLILITIGKCKDAITIFNDLNTSLRSEINIYKKHKYIQYIIYVFFHIDSLIAHNSNSNNNSNAQTMVVHSLFSCFISYLRTNNAKQLVSRLQSIETQMKDSKDYNGLVWVIFNKAIITYIYEGECAQSAHSTADAVDAKVKLGALIYALNCDKPKTLTKEIESQKMKCGNGNNCGVPEAVPKLIDEKVVDKVVKLFKMKLDTICVIYKYLVNIEKEIVNEMKLYTQHNNNSTNNSNSSNDELLIRILITYAINKLKQQHINNNDTITIQMISHLQETRALLRSNLDIGQLTLDMLNSELCSSLYNTLSNILLILEKRIKHKAYTKLTTSLRSAFLHQRSLLLDQFLKQQYNSICSCKHEATKINLNTVGRAKRYYQFNYKRNEISIYTAHDKKEPDKRANVLRIVKFTNGIESYNLYNKITTAKGGDNEYLYMSWFENGRSVDLRFNELSTGKIWVYGLYYYCRESKQLFKVMSCSKYVLTVLLKRMLLHANGNYNNRSYNKVSFVKALLQYKRSSSINW